MGKTGFTSGARQATLQRMPHVIHYFDDLFLIDGMARLLLDLSRLEPDADVLGDSVLVLLRAADSSFRKIKDLVSANAHLVERAEYLRLMARTAASLSEALSALLRPDSSMYPALKSSSDELDRMLKSHRSSADALRDELHVALNDGASAGDLVSGDELSELLRGNDSV